LAVIFVRKDLHRNRVLSNMSGYTRTKNLLAAVFAKNRLHRNLGWCNMNGLILGRNRMCAWYAPKRSPNSLDSNNIKRFTNVLRKRPHRNNLMCFCTIESFWPKVSILLEFIPNYITEANEMIFKQVKHNIKFAAIV